MWLSDSPTMSQILYSLELFQSVPNANPDAADCVTKDHAQRWDVSATPGRTGMKGTGRMVRWLDVDASAL